MSRRYTPIRIIKGAVFAWVRKGTEYGLPAFSLAQPIKLKRLPSVLSFPRNTSVVQRLENPRNLLRVARTDDVS